MSVSFNNPSQSLMPQLPSVNESGLCAETRLTTQSLRPAPIRVKDGVLIQTSERRVGRPAPLTARMQASKETVVSELIGSQPEPTRPPGSSDGAHKPSLSTAPRLFPLSDSGNAELFAARYGKSLRFDHKRGRWLIWDKGRWSEDKTGRVRQMTKAAARLRRKIAFDFLSAPDDASAGENALRKQHVMFALRS